MLRIEKSVSEYNVRSTVFLKHRTNWDSVRSAVMQEHYMDHFEVSDPSVAFDRAIGEVIGRYVPTTVLRSRSGDNNGLMPEDAEDSTLLAVVLNTAERSAVAASLTRDLTIGFRSGAITGA